MAHTSADVGEDSKERQVERIEARGGRGRKGFSHDPKTREYRCLLGSCGAPTGLVTIAGEGPQINQLCESECS